MRTVEFRAVSILRGRGSLAGERSLDGDFELVINISWAVRICQIEFIGERVDGFLGGVDKGGVKRAGDFGVSFRVGGVSIGSRDGT